MNEHFGTRSCYNKGCRQESCRKANSSYIRKLRSFKFGQRVRGVDGDWYHPADYLVHGTSSSYDTHGCRCVVCRIFTSKRKRRGRSVRVVNSEVDLQ